MAAEENSGSRLMWKGSGVSVPFCFPEENVDPFLPSAGGERARAEMRSGLLQDPKVFSEHKTVGDSSSEGGEDCYLGRLKHKRLTWGYLL